MDKKKIQEAIARIDNAIAQLNVNRQVHIALVNDVRLVQDCCMERFNVESKNVGTDKPTKRPKSVNKNS